MKRSLRVSTGALVVAAIMAWSSSAAFAKAFKPFDEPLDGSGAITYVWHGDPSRGCAAAGLCGISGSLILRADTFSDAFSFSPRSAAIGLDIPPVVRVQRVAATGSPGDCTEAAGSDGSLGLRVTRRRNVWSAVLEPPISSGHCAGPTSSDLARIELPVRTTGGRYATYDLRGTRRFVAGPLSGTVVSTMIFRPDRSTRTSVETGGGGFPPLHRRLVEHVALRYRLTSPQSTLATSFHSASSSTCWIYDSCALSGSLSLSLPSLNVVFEVGAARVVKRRVSSAQALADFKAGRLHLNGGGTAQGSQLSLNVVETLRRNGVGACRDSSRSPGTYLFGTPRRGGQLELQLVDPNEMPLLRTRCPGPFAADVIAGRHGIIASGQLSHGDLTSPHSSPGLSWTGGFSGPVFDGSRSGALTLSLSLVKVTAGTRSELL